MRSKSRTIRLRWSYAACVILATCVVPIAAKGVQPKSSRASGGDDKRPSADLIIVNAKVWTGARESGKGDPADTGTTSIAIVGDRIVGIGDEFRAPVPGTKIIDARGRRVIPGITDSHTHIISGGFQLDRLALRDVKDRDAFVRAVAAAVKKTEAGQWVLGGRWSVESWEDRTPPDRGWLDPVSRETPIFLSRMDGHQALVNSAALKLAGIDAAGPDDPVGGQIVRDPETKEPTGILKGAAKELVREHIPKSTTRQRYGALVRAMKHANSLGITSVHDMSELDDLKAFRQAHKDSALTLRITSYLSVDDWPAHINTVKQFPVNDEMLRIVGLKGYMDGSLGSRTAWMRDPYDDAKPSDRYPRGQLTAFASDPQRLQSTAVAAAAAGCQLAVHAIGDEANHLVLNAYEHIRRLESSRQIVLRIEHAQHLLVGDIPRFARLDVVASMQPYHKADDGRYAESAIGQARLPGSYAFRQLVDAGVLLCFGSDWPAVTLNPFAGMDAAVNARTLSGDVWLASHSLTTEEALTAYTSAPPRAIQIGGSLGTIETGKLADLVILDSDPLTLPEERLGDIKVQMTIVGGRVVFSRQP